MPELHAKVSPSKLPRLMACPGSLLAEAAVPEAERPPPSQAAIDGTRRHALSEWAKHNPTAPWPTEVGEHKILFDDVLAVKKILPYFTRHPTHPNSTGKGSKLFLTEQRVEIGRFCGLEEGLLWGTADTVMATQDVLEIADDKYGHFPVQPDNWQNKAYAIGAGALLVDPMTGQFKREFQMLREVKLTIAQPTKPEGQEIQSQVYPIDALMSWAKEIGAGVKKAQDPAAPRIPGEKQCKFCLYAPKCPERMAMVASTMFEGFGVTQAPAPTPQETPIVTAETPPPVAGAPAPIATVDAIVDIAEVKMTQAPEEMTPEEIAKVLDMAGLVEGWFKSIRQYANSLLASGKPVPGYKLIAGKRSRAWTTETEDELIERLKGCGFKESECYTRSVLTPNQAEKSSAMERVHNLKRNKEKKLQAFADLWTWKAGKPTLAPESDPAPAINTPETMFEAVPETQPAEAEAAPAPSMPAWF